MRSSGHRRARWGHDGSTPRLRSDRLGLADAVELLGQWPDVPGLLQAADLFAFPSVYEGMPGAVIEAMALGVPIVASDIPPVREILGSDEGVLVPAGDPQALADGLLDLLRDRERASRLASAARARFLEKFTLEHSVAAMAGLYRRTTGQMTHLHPPSWTDQ